MLKPIVLTRVRPGIMNPGQWRGGGCSQQPGWNRLRQRILQRDGFKCLGCGHRARKWMMIHHVGRSDDDSPGNLATVCVACHAVLHLGLNMTFGGLQVWRSPFSQITIIRRTRAGVQAGLSLAQINETLKLRPGPHPPGSLLYANRLIRSVGRRHRASLPEPLCAVFVSFVRWQINDDFHGTI
jgi:hypothetical protein